MNGILQTTYVLCFGEAFFESCDFSRKNTNIDVSVFMFYLRMINMSSECEYDWYWKISACSPEYEVCDSFASLTRHQTSYSGSAGRYFRHQSIHIQITYTSLSISNLQVKAPFILTFPHRLCVNMDAPVFVITIKLGTKTCEIASSFKHNPTKVMSNVFSSGSTQSTEFPSSLFLARNDDVSFGYEAQKIFTDSRGGGVFFGNFGECLYLSEVCYFHNWLIHLVCLTPLSAIFQLYHGDQI